MDHATYKFYLKKREKIPCGLKPQLIPEPVEFFEIRSEAGKRGPRHGGPPSRQPGLAAWQQATSVERLVKRLQLGERSRGQERPGNTTGCGGRGNAAWRAERMPTGAAGAIAQCSWSLWTRRASRAPGSGPAPEVRPHALPAVTRRMPAQPVALHSTVRSPLQRAGRAGPAGRQLCRQAATRTRDEPSS